MSKVIAVFGKTLNAASPDIRHLHGPIVMYREDIPEAINYPQRETIWQGFAPAGE